MTDQIGSGTAQGAIDYLNSLVVKGRSREGVVRPLKIALTKVLEKTEGEDKWGQTSVLDIDLDDTMNRFKNFTLGTYNDASYRAYYLRVQRAITWYKNFLENPGWAPDQSKRLVNAQSKKDKKVTSSSEATAQQAKPIELAQENNAQQQSTQKVDTIDTDMLAYPFPLQDGGIARLYLPKTISKLDAKRLASFISALTLEDQEV